MTVRPFRFGLSLWGAASRDDWRRKAQKAEAAGFDSLLIADHLVDGMFTSLAALVAAAEATDHVRVGTLVTNNDFRHPVLLARDAATVDLMTGGRLELGLGAGHMKHEYDAAGLAFDPAAVRVARMTEAATIVRGLLAGEEVTFHGAHYTVDAQRCYPVPDRPVPLLIGGNGRGVLRAAARLADIVGFTGFSQVEGEQNVNPNHFTDASLREQIEWVRTAAPDRFDQLELSTLVQGVTITTDRRATARDLQPLLPSLSVDEILSSPYGLIGTPEQIADQIRDRRERLGISYLTVFEKDIDAMADVIALVRA